MYVSDVSLRYYQVVDYCKSNLSRLWLFSNNNLRLNCLFLNFIQKSMVYFEKFGKCTRFAVQNHIFNENSIKYSFQLGRIWYFLSYHVLFIPFRWRSTTFSGMERVTRMRLSLPAFVAPKCLLFRAAFPCTWTASTGSRSLMPFYLY